MMPTLAQRVCPSTATWACSLRSARRSSWSSATAARIARVLSPSSPISAAALYTTDRQRPANRAAPPWNSGSPARSETAATIAGSSRSRSWSQTKTCNPAESRPRTSMRSIADNACWIARYPASALGPASRPARSTTARGRAQAIAADRPQRIAQRDQLGAAPLEGVDVEVAGGQLGVDLGGVGIELVEAGDDRRDQLGVLDEGEQPRHAVEDRVDLAQERRHGADVTARGQRGVETGEHLGRRRHRSGGLDD